MFSGMSAKLSRVFAKNLMLARVPALKAINMKEVIYMVANAHDEMPLSTFMNSWRKTWPNSVLLIVKNKEENRKTNESNLHGFEPADNVSILNDLRLYHSDDLVQDVAEWITGQDDEESRGGCMRECLLYLINQIYIYCNGILHLQKRSICI